MSKDSIDDSKLPQDVDHIDAGGFEQSLDDDPDAEFGGREARRKMEKQLLRKLDLRMSILVIIYILNYVSTPLGAMLCY